MTADPSWREDLSETFLDLGRYFVPHRERQAATVVGAIAEPEGPAHCIDLCCGEGLLAEALLERFPQATVHGFDGSPAMLEAARNRLARFGERFQTREIDLFDPAWRRELPWPLHAVVSSLALHHLDGAGKARLFRDVHAALAPGGALVVADLIEPADGEARRIAALAWDEAVRQRSLALSGDLSAFERFEATRWNLYSDPEPDPVDKPSPLYAQLRWLEQAGFVAVDVYWLLAGHAIFGGKKAR